MCPAQYKQGSHPYSYGKCPLCNSDNIRLITDHCHKHGYIRGRICESCNQMLKVFDKRPILPWKWSVPPKFIAHALKCSDCNPGLWVVMILNSTRSSNIYSQYEYL